MTPDKRLRYIEENQDSLGTAKEKLILLMLNSEVTAVPVLSPKEPARHDCFPS